MMVVTHITLKPGAEPEWDATIRERLAGARTHRGWRGAQVLIPLDGPNRRVIIGSWNTRADWEAWHEDPTFATTRDRLCGLEAAPREMIWHEVIEDRSREAKAA